MIWQKPPEKQHRFFQFSLRQLLVLFAVLSMLFAAVAPQVFEVRWRQNEFRRERENRYKLARAVDEDDVRLVRRVLEAGVNPNEDSGRCELLVPAIENGQIEIVKLLLEYGAYPLGISTAIESDQPREVRLSMIRCLVRHGADLSRESIGGAGMNAALRTTDEAVCDLLHELGMDYGPREMAILNRLEELQRVVEEKPGVVRERVRPFETFWQGEDPTLLGIALCRGYREMAVYLIDQGTPLDTTEGEGATLLHRAALGSDTELIRLLINRGLDVNARDDHGATPLAENILNSSPEAIDALIELGADMNARTIGDRTALHEAATHQRTDVVRTLLAAGADPAIVDSDGRTILKAVREQLARRLGDRDDPSCDDQYREEAAKAVRNYREIEAILLEASR